MITLFKAYGSWQAQHSDNKELIKLFGTNTIPTAFTDKIPGEYVLQRIRVLNPHEKVELT